MKLWENVLIDSVPSNSITQVTLKIAYKQLWLIGTENSRNLVMGIPSFFLGHKWFNHGHWKWWIKKTVRWKVICMTPVVRIISMTSLLEYSDAEWFEVFTVYTDVIRKTWHFFTSKFSSSHLQKSQSNGGNKGHCQF